MNTCTCSDCGNPATRSGRTLCEKHYYRLRRTGSLELSRRERAPHPGCSIEGCARPATTTGRTLCLMHFKRIRNTGSPDPRPRAIGEVCTVPDCGQARKTLDGYCGLHHDRFRRNGDPLLVHPNGRWTGDAATYEAVHQRLPRERGRARSHRCVDCGRQARHWSYSHEGGDAERQSDIGPYSVNLADYEPRCVSCHKTYDLGKGAL